MKKLENAVLIYEKSIGLMSEDTNFTNILNYRTFNFNKNAKPYKEEQFEEEKIDKKFEWKLKILNLWSVEYEKQLQQLRQLKKEFQEEEEKEMSLV